MNTNGCPVCLIAGVSIERASGDSLSIHCPRCRRYVVTGSNEAELAHKDMRFRDLLSGRIRRHWNETGQPLVLRDDALDHVERSALRGVLAKQEALLLDVSKQSGYPGAIVNIGPNDAVVVDAGPGNELLFHVQSLVEQGLLKPLGGSGEVVVSAKGWEHLEQRQNPVTGNRTDFFVAMSFSPAMRQVWDHGVCPAVTAAGYVAKRVDTDPHNDKIDDRIVAGIRRSFGVIADMTEQKGGTYFEAGFALGIGRPVVWMVREDEIEKVHFDTRQFAHLLWADADDLRNKLTTHLVAVFGQGPGG